MTEIYTVYIMADHFRDEEGKVCSCSPDENSWIDSYWTNPNDAIAEAERLWEEDAIDEFIVHLAVFGRKVNMRGSGENTWDDSRDRLIKRWA